MQLTVNGERRDVAEVSSVEDLLRSMGMPLDRVAVEVNGVLVRRAERASRRLSEGDVVEIVTLVGGG